MDLLVPNFCVISGLGRTAYMQIKSETTAATAWKEVVLEITSLIIKTTTNQTICELTLVMAVVSLLH